MRGAALLVLACAALPSAALEEVAWPPSGDAAARMRELQQVIVSREATPAQRDQAREELGRMLMRDQRPLPDDKGRKPRAAIEPFPSVMNVWGQSPMSNTRARGAQLDSGPIYPGGVARVEVIVPPRAIHDPRTGTTITPVAPPPASPTQPFAVDPRTGSVLHGVGGGYVDPRTGQFSPR